MKPFICNRDFAVAFDGDIEKGKKVLDVLYSMGLRWSSGKSDKYSVLKYAICSYGADTCLLVEKKEKCIYYGDKGSFNKRPTRLSYNEFIEELRT
jgi:hypothetical protein